MLKVLEHILMSQPAEHPEHAAYSEAVKELQVDGMYELQRLATKMPDQLLVSSVMMTYQSVTDSDKDVYDQLEAKVKEIIDSGKLESKRQVSYQTFLFTIMYVLSYFNHKFAHGTDT
jgi:exportin-5